MNIFYLDTNPELAAQMHCDKHVVKMILETAQLLSTAHHLVDGTPSIECYKLTHKNHPSSIWVRENKEQYQWAWHLLQALCKEYTHRYDKVHKVEWSGLLERLRQQPHGLSSGEYTAPPQCMPDYCKHDITKTAYRNYYKQEKGSIATWNKTRPAPDWMVEEMRG